jgi:hypothetical protein
MALLAVRTKFVQLSGRLDLANVTTFADNGADWFINAGIRMLDRKANHVKSFAWYNKDLTAGQYSLTPKYMQSVKEVWATKSDNVKVPLVRKTQSWLRENYGDQFSSVLGDPEIYAPIVVGLAPELSTSTLASHPTFTNDDEDIVYEDHFAYSGILIFPAAQETTTISILGRFNSKILSTDTDKNFWTEMHPDICVLAAMWALEGFYRNTEGQNDYLNSILDGLSDLDKDVVEDEATGDLEG